MSFPLLLLLVLLICLVIIVMIPLPLITIFLHHIIIIVVLCIPPPPPAPSSESEGARAARALKAGLCATSSAPAASVRLPLRLCGLFGPDASRQGRTVPTKVLQPLGCEPPRPMLRSSGRRSELCPHRAGNASMANRLPQVYSGSNPHKPCFHYHSDEDVCLAYTASCRKSDERSLLSVDKLAHKYS